METHLAICSPPRKLSFPIQLYHRLPKDQNLAAGPTSPEQTPRQLWVCPLAAASFAKLEEQRAPSPGAWAGDAKAVSRTLSGFPGRLENSPGRRKCLPRRCPIMCCWELLSASFGLWLSFIFLVSEDIYLDLQTIPAHATFLNNFLICKLSSPSSAVHISCDQYGQKPAVQ